MRFYISALQHATVLIMHTHIININDGEINVTLNSSLKVKVIVQTTQSCYLHALLVIVRSFMHGDPHNQQRGSSFLFLCLGIWYEVKPNHCKELDVSMFSLVLEVISVWFFNSL